MWWKKGEGRRREEEKEDEEEEEEEKRKKGGREGKAKGEKETHIQKRREKLLHDQIRHILRLRRHPHRLGPDVHAKHLRRPDPDRRAPGRFVEEDEQEK